jgi:Na+/phosphate symporter
MSTDLLLIEKLTNTDKNEIKSLISKELKSALADEVRKEVQKVFKSADTKDAIGDITKKVLKRLYKDLSFQHPYIIDRIKIK